MNGCTETTKSTKHQDHHKANMDEPPPQRIPSAASIQSIVTEEGGHTEDNMYSSHIVSTLFNELMKAIGDSVYGIGIYLYKLLYLGLETWFLHGPRWWFLYALRGHGGIPEKDICASLIGTKSDSFEGPGMVVCENYINNIITERTLFVCVLLIAAYIKYGLPLTCDYIHSVYNYKEFQKKKMDRELQNQKSYRTKKFNADLNANFRAMCAILHNDDIYFASQINALRTVLNNINNEDVLEAIKWRPVMDKEWKTQKLTENKKMIMAIGDGS